MKILIIEDETIAAERMRQMVTENIPDAEIVGLCDSVDESVQFLRRNPMPDLLLMDIELVDGQSFEIFNEVKITSPVIFTTAYDEFVLRAFSVHSIDYLLKPIQVEDLIKSISKFRELQSMYNKQPGFLAEEFIKEMMKSRAVKEKTPREHFLVKQGHKLISINATEIAYFFSEERLTYLRTYEGKQYLLDQPLEELEEQVDERRFFRASRKFLIERRSIQNVLIYFNGKLKVTVKPEPNDDIIVSRDRSHDFKKWLGE